MVIALILVVIAALVGVTLLTPLLKVAGGLIALALNAASVVASVIRRVAQRASR